MQISNLKRFILFDFKFQKQKHLQLFIQCLYFILQNSLVLKSKLKYKSITTQSVFFDMLFPLQQLNFLKMGGNLDSLIKTQAVIVYTKILTNVLFIFDKYSVVYLIKKTTENSWAVTTPAIAKLRRNFLGIFKLFWYATTVLIVFIFFI